MPDPQQTPPESNASSHDARDEQATPDVSRRRFLQRVSALGLVGLGSGALLSACGGGEDGGTSTDDAASDDAAASGTADEATAGDATMSEVCTDVSDLSATQQQQRETMVQSLNYVTESEIEGKMCSNCSFYQAAQYDTEQCGGCTLFPGPVNAQGYCSSWNEAAS
jgi:hypothetical protein